MPVQKEGPATKVAGLQYLNANSAYSDFGKRQA
jgi:hypothetical protein